MGMWQTLSGKYATPLLLEPGPSLALHAWLVLSHVVTILILPFMALALWPGLILMLVVCFSLSRTIRLHVTRSHPDSVCAVEWFEAGTCKLQLASGKDIKVRLMPQVFMLSWLVIMHFKSDRGRVHHLVLLPEMLDRRVFRRLRVRLMIEVNEAVAKPC